MVWYFRGEQRIDGDQGRAAALGPLCRIEMHARGWHSPQKMISLAPSAALYRRQWLPRVISCPTVPPRADGVVKRLAPNREESHGHRFALSIHGPRGCRADPLDSAPQSRDD